MKFEQVADSIEAGFHLLVHQFLSVDNFGRVPWALASSCCSLQMPNVENTAHSHSLSEVTSEYSHQVKVSFEYLVQFYVQLQCCLPMTLWAVFRVCHAPECWMLLLD